MYLKRVYGYQVVICLAVVMHALAAPDRQDHPSGPCEDKECLEHNKDKVDIISQEEIDNVNIDKMHALLHGGELIDHDAPSVIDASLQEGIPNTADIEAILHGGEHVDHNAPSQIDKNIHDGKIPNTADIEAILHGGEHVDHNAPSQIDQNIHDGKIPNTGDIEAILHGGEHVDHNAPRQIDTNILDGKIPSTADMEVILHGGEHVDHNAPRKNFEISGKHRSMVDLHDVLHGGQLVDHNKLPEKVVNMGQPIVTDLESVLHGLDNSHDIHTRTKETAKKEGAPPGILDPHALIHGEHKLGTNGLHEYERKDFEEWQKKQKSEDKEDDYSMLGFSFPYISDTILNEIEMLKRRYLPRYWTTDLHKPDDVYDNVPEINVDNGIKDVNDDDVSNSIHVSRVIEEDVDPKEQRTKRIEI